MNYIIEPNKQLQKPFDDIPFRIWEIIEPIWKTTEPIRITSEPLWITLESQCEYLWANMKNIFEPIWKTSINHLAVWLIWLNFGSIWVNLAHWLVWLWAGSDFSFQNIEPMSQVWFSWKCKFCPHFQDLWFTTLEIFIYENWKLQLLKGKKISKRH